MMRQEISRRASSIATVRPTGPAPTTRTSVSKVLVVIRLPIPFICPGFEHAKRNSYIRPMLVDALRVEHFPSVYTFKPDRNSHQQLVWIACYDRGFGLALDDQLPHSLKEDLPLPAYLFKQVGRGLLRTLHLIH